MFIIALTIIVLVYCFFAKRSLTIDNHETFERRLSEIPGRQLLYLYNPKVYKKVHTEKPWDELDKEIDRQIRSRDFNLEKLKACHFDG